MEPAGSASRANDLAAGLREAPDDDDLRVDDVSPEAEERRAQRQTLEIRGRALLQLAQEALQEERTETAVSSLNIKNRGPVDGVKTFGSQAGNGKNAREKTSLPGGGDAALSSLAIDQITMNLFRQQNPGQLPPFEASSAVLSRANGTHVRARLERARGQSTERAQSAPALSPPSVALADRKEASHRMPHDSRELDLPTSVMRTAEPPSEIQDGEPSREDSSATGVPASKTVLARAMTFGEVKLRQPKAQRTVTVVDDPPRSPPPYAHRNDTAPLDAVTSALYSAETHGVPLPPPPTRRDSASANSPGASTANAAERLARVRNDRLNSEPLNVHTHDVQASWLERMLDGDHPGRQANLSLTALTHTVQSSWLDRMLDEHEDEVRV